MWEFFKNLKPNGESENLPWAIFLFLVLGSVLMSLSEKLFGAAVTNFFSQAVIFTTGSLALMVIIGGFIWATIYILKFLKDRWSEE